MNTAWDVREILQAHSQYVKEQIPTFSHWPVIAPPAGQLLHNTFLEQNGPIFDVSNVKESTACDLDILYFYSHCFLA